MKNNEIGIVYSLMFTNEEALEIEAFLKENEYSVDKDGLKEFIKDCVFEDEEQGEETKENPFAKAIKDNPEVAQQLGNMAMNLGQKFFKNKFKL